jgi:hypothetical protein
MQEMYFFRPKKKSKLPFIICCVFILCCLIFFYYKNNKKHKIINKPLSTKKPFHISQPITSLKPKLSTIIKNGDISTETTKPTLTPFNIELPTFDTEETDNMCADEEFLSTDNKCTPTTKCKENQYMSEDYTSNSDRQCHNLTVCDKDEYESTSSTENSDRICTKLTECLEDEFIFENPNYNTDRICKNTTTCMNDEYEFTPPTEASDRICKKKIGHKSHGEECLNNSDCESNNCASNNICCKADTNGESQNCSKCNDLSHDYPGYCNKCKNGYKFSSTGNWKCVVKPSKTTSSSGKTCLPWKTAQGGRQKSFAKNDSDNICGDPGGSTGYDWCYISNESSNYWEAC